MQPLVMRTIAKLVEQLRSNSTTPPAALSHHKIDAREAEFSSGGSVIFPDISDTPQPDWSIFHLYEIDRTGKERAFKLSGTLRAQASADEFVARAYTLILMRNLDDAGRRIYPELLKSGKLRRWEVLRILAKSQEAQALDRQCLIVPQPSVWLAPCQPESMTPLLIIGA